MDLKRKLSLLVKAPELNPKTRKAYSIPILNPINIYGRSFHLSWLGFFVSFLSWFAFPPLLAHSIKKDLNMTSADVANNNIAGLCATMLGRVILGPVCDRIGPRYAMALVLLVGSVPTAFVPLVNNIPGLHAIRFFVGLLGSSFIPCQVWTTVFFDKTIVGTANAFAGGFGNSGGGVAFFMMPAILNDLLKDGYSQRKSWSYAFVIGPFVILIFVSCLILLFGQDCPEGKWSQRGDVLDIGVDVRSVDVVSINAHHPVLSHISGAAPPVNRRLSEDKIGAIDERTSDNSISDNAVDVVKTRVSDVVDLEQIVENPTWKSFLMVSFHYRTMLVALPYIVTFGGELAIESVLSALYMQRAKIDGLNWNQSKSGSWASMIGLLNVVTRPLGGIISDYLYKTFKTTRAKKFWLLFCACMQGIFLIWIGFVPSSKLSLHGLIASISVMCVFMEAGNGACFSLVPHINPKNVGIVSGITGAFGNIGGIFFSLVFRFSLYSNGTNDYMRGFWIIGICCVAIAVVCSFLPVSEDRYVAQETVNDHEKALA